MKFLDYKLIAFVNHKIWNNELGKLIPTKQNQYYMDMQQQQQQEQDSDINENETDEEDNLNEINQQYNNTAKITNTTTAPKPKILNNFQFACKDIRSEFQNTPTQIIRQEQLLIDLNSETDPTIPMQPATATTKTTTTFTKSTITSTYTTESFTNTTTTTNNTCKHC